MRIVSSVAMVAVGVNALQSARRDNPDRVRARAIGVALLTAPIVYLSSAEPVKITVAVAVTIVSMSVTPEVRAFWARRSVSAAGQPFEEFRKLARYRLAAGYGSIAATDTLEASHPLFKQPTTGVIVGRDLYYIANAPLQAFLAIYKDGAFDRSALSPVVILKTRLAP